MRSHEKADRQYFFFLEANVYITNSAQISQSMYMDLLKKLWQFLVSSPKVVLRCITGYVISGIVYTLVNHSSQLMRARELS